ncbi:MAG: S-formylglutathione hydrolase [Rhizobiaceae bacterium]|nr:S-formylglutathione hydrolase [Rhizobiaceae bacterium]
MKIISTARSHGGIQGVYSHASTACNCDMTFAVFVPPQAAERPCPVLWYLSGLTCNHSNVMDKGEYRAAAAEHGIIIVCPDTSPRGDDVPDEADNWQFGQGAGFYLDATQEPFNKHYRMYSYITSELTVIVASKFNVDMSKQGIFGHSMGGHGALTIALKDPERFASVSAFAPIAEPSKADWSLGALEKYLGSDQSKWRDYDICMLLEDGNQLPEILVDQGASDDHLERLGSDALKLACEKAGVALTHHMREGYDHSYFFVSSFMASQIAWHAERLNKA